MFTGIVRDVGAVVRVEPHDGASLYEISTRLPRECLGVGASVACSGVCLTVIGTGTGSAGEATFKVQVSNATLDKTTIGLWEAGTPVNLEPSLKLGDEMGGHIVTGHVDGVAVLDRIYPDGESHRMIFTAPEELAPYIATKGSVALDGVSLTVNVVDSARFSVNIIPHTWGVTTLGQTKVGQKLNIEIDPLARYVARRLEFPMPKDV